MTFEETMKELGAKPVKANWERFRKGLKRSKLRYYSIKFDKSRVKKLEDLRKAHAELYDANQKLVFQVPIYIDEGGKIRGATIYLKGLLNLNK